MNQLNTPRSSQLDRWEWIFFIAVLIYSTSSFDAALSGGLAPDIDPRDFVTQSTSTDGGPLLVLIQLMIIAVTGWLIQRRWSSFLQAVLSRRSTWLFAFWAIASTGWSPLPDITGRRAFMLLMTHIVCVYIGMRYPMRRQLQLLAWAMGLTLLINAVFTLAVPNIGIHNYEHPGAWRGLTIQKNALAQLAAISGNIFSILLLYGKRTSRWEWIGMMFSILMVLLTTSKTALLLIILPIAIIPILQALRWQNPLALPIFAICFLIAGGLSIEFVDNYEFLVRLIGRDPSFTGRTDIWGAVIENIEERPWLGYGFYAFWRGMEGPSSTVWYRMFLVAGSAHNGYLDVAVELGLIGMVLWILSLLVNLLRSFTWLRRNQTPEGLWPIIHLLVLILYNFSESTTPLPFRLTWMIYLMITTTVLVQPLADSRPSLSAESSATSSRQTG